MMRSVLVAWVVKMHVAMHHKRCPGNIFARMPGYAHADMKASSAERLTHGGLGLG
jgi:hypothetical protein